MFENLTTKQEYFINDVINNRLERINILEGSVRSGKTYVSLIGWMILLSMFDQNAKFLMVGKTITSLKRNCLVILEDLCPKEDFSYSISKKEATLFKRKIFLEGVNDIRAEQKIRGMTLQAAYCDEVTLFTEDFFSMLLSRLSMPNSKLIGTTNPDSPSHWLMRKFLVRKNDISIKLWKFFLDDNYTIPEKIRNEMKKEYTGVFYDRFILGRWVQAEGLIYKNFADNKENFIIENINPNELDAINIGIDYGASMSKTAFVAVGLTHGFKKMIVLDEYTSLGVTSPDILYEKFLNFANKVKQEYGWIGSCYADWGGLGQVLTRGLKQYCIKNDLALTIRDCQKIRIIERINIVSRLISTDNFRICRRCKETIESLASAIWEEGKDDVRLDNGTVNIDVLDAMEYAMTRYANYLSYSTN